MRSIGLSIGVAILALGFMLIVNLPRASAAEFLSGDSPEVAANETVNDDLYIAGGTATIAGRVTGDVQAIAGEIIVSGQVNGSLQVLGGDVDVRGSVDGSLRVLAGNVTISGEVAGDIVMAGGALTLQSGGAVTGDVILAGGEIDLSGPVRGDVRGTVGTLTINGRITGDVDVTSDDLHLLSKARIGGDLHYKSANEATLASGAAVTGETVRTERKPYSPGDSAGSWLISPLFRLLCGLIAGLLLVLLVPRAMASVGDAARLAPLTSFLLGLLLFVLIPVALLILTITLVGAPIALIGLLAYICVIYLSQVFLGIAIGRFILPKSWDAYGRGYNLLAMTIGVLILAGLRMIPFPFVSTGIAMLSAVIAVGAVTVAIRSSRRQVGMAG